MFNMGIPLNGPNSQRGCVFAFVNPWEGRGKEMGQNELKRFTSTCAAGKMA